MQNKPNLLNAQMNVSPFITKDYENDNTFRLPENKPNTNPIRTQSNPISEKPKMNVTSILTKDYESERLYRCGENKPNTNPIKPNLVRRLVRRSFSEVGSLGEAGFKPDTLLLCG